MVSKIVEQAKEEFQKDQEHWEPIYRAAREDIYFLSDRPDAQWTQYDLKSRQQSGRPVLTVDQLGQYVNQVVNDIRKNTPSIEVIPDVDGAIEEAEIQQDLIRDILYNSDADTCFDIAATYAVKSSIGFIRIDTAYNNKKQPFDQQLVIEPIHDPLTCYLDRDSKDITGKDAKHCFILSNIEKDKFENDYPNKGLVSFTEDTCIKGGRNSVVVAEYFTLVTKQKRIGVTYDGIIEEVQPDVIYMNERKIEEKSIKRYLLSGEDVLEKSEFIGEFLPLVPVYGNQAWVNGEREIYSLIRKSKDAQRMFNFWKSLETELLQKQPKATFMAAIGQIEDFAEAWEDPDNSPVLPYKPTDIGGNQVAPPIRLDPPPVPAGIVNASRSAVDDIKSTIGMYAASLGQTSNEVSGIAIQRRVEEGDTATYHFGDNLNKSIAHVGRLLACAIPEVYDTPRFVSIIDKEGTSKIVGINGAVANDQERTFDLTRGTYKTKVITGPSYTTQRQEAAKLLNDVIVKNPELTGVVGDLLFKNLDIAGADAIAERMKRYIDPKYLDIESEYDPEKAQMQQVISEGQDLLARQQAEIDDLLDQLRDKQGELVIKARSEENKKQSNEDKNIIDMRKVKAFEEKAEREYQFKMAALELKQRELELEELRKLEVERKRNVAMYVEQPEEPEDESPNKQVDSVELEIKN